MAWPWRHPFKKFPQFEHLPEAEARVAASRMVRDIHGHLMFEGISAGVIATVVRCVVLIPAAILIRMGNGIPGAGLITPAMTVLPAALVGYLWGSRHHRDLLRAALETRLTSDPQILARRCAECEYSLVGLPMKSDRTITCPECGQGCVVPPPSSGPPASTSGAAAGTPV